MSDDPKPGEYVSIAAELRALGEEWRGEWPDGRVCKADLNEIADRIEAAAVNQRVKREDEEADGDRAHTRRRGYSRAMQQMMRIYGADFIRAFKALEIAHKCVDAGSVALAGTHARYAAVMLAESGQVNDRGRTPQSIVAEIATVFDPKPRMNFQELWVFDEHCINEICNRLGCNRGTALGLLKEWREGGGHKQLNAPQVEEEEEIVDGEVVAELEPGGE